MKKVPRKNSGRNAKNITTVHEVEDNDDSSSQSIKGPTPPSSEEDDDKTRAAKRDAIQQELGVSEDELTQTDTPQRKKSTSKSPAVSSGPSGLRKQRDFKFINQRELEESMASFIEGYPLIWKGDDPDHCNAAKKQQVWDLAEQQFGVPGEYQIFPYFHYFPYLM